MPGQTATMCCLWCVWLVPPLQIGLVLLDEVHLLNESGRGSSLEAGCVCRIKAVAAFPQMAQAPIASARFVAVSATIPNIHDVRTVCHTVPSGR